MGGLSDFREVMKQVFSGKIVPVVDSVYPPIQARKAYARCERGEQLGKIVFEKSE
jgi:D-arabinose 1-dehydrogenase-like Zn-dependent alcohol dehydrogenase